MKLIILDRDGVINYDSENYIKSPQEWIAIPGSLDAIAKLTKAGYTITVASNQSGIARGLYDEQGLQAIHRKMLNACQDAGGKIDSIFYCPHTPEQHCHCRKPQPGLFEQIAKHYSVNLQGVPYIGDRLTDIAVAKCIGAFPIMVETCYLPEQDDVEHLLVGVPVFANLLQAAEAIIEKNFWRNNAK